MCKTTNFDFNATSMPCKLTMIFMLLTQKCSVGTAQPGQWFKDHHVCFSQNFPLVYLILKKVKNDHRSKFSNLSNWKEEARRKQDFDGIRTRDLRVTGALLYQLSYEATHWERGQFSPDFFFRLLLSNCLNWKIYCDDHSSLSSTTAVQI